ncbi:MAG: XRE family transcriptional regulator [Oscillospiraceae bacterium]|nr:XRE family transcriptional regulator [Oscillospiraceae bacterium]
MEGCKFTDFGLLVKTELLKCGRSQTWLEKTVTEKTGLFVDSSYMYKILTGERNAPKIVDAIRKILDIPDSPTEQKTTQN